jgi:hypothetical protein
MLWTGAPLVRCEFAIGKQRYGLSMDDDRGAEPPVVAAKMRLRDVLKPRKTIIDQTYDFGDCWAHRLAVSNIRAGQPGISYPRFIKYAIGRIADHLEADRTRLAKKNHLGSAA